MNNVNKYSRFIEEGDYKIGETVRVTSGVASINGWIGVVIASSKHASVSVEFPSHDGLVLEFAMSASIESLDKPVKVVFT